ncbi:tetratricopeptide repeat-containing sensor histidine kinase [Flavobacterium restrictum]|uniref:histidine kinase n=1 Tax=Flavobacterium restrictum TaxID=2594428 RepID=A0A553E9A9_9FLAO|nr:sensor histidine kinase [Flavobacterium restrictum]TRX41512.1 tetratricopeptide repeat protein [Flavobacterium restrictum]
MRKTVVFLISFLLTFQLFFSQSKKEIDSLNAISFEIRLAKAVQLTDNYLQNAKNAQKISYKLGEAESFSNLSLIYYYQGKFEKDLYYSLLAIHIYEAIGNKEKLALEYGELGYRMKKRNMAKALYYMQKAKNISEKNNIQKPLLSIYNNYGYLKELQKEQDSALYYYKKGLKIKERIKDSLGIPYSLNNIALIYIQKKQFKAAEILLNRSLRIRYKLNDQIGIAENNFYLGDLNFNQNSFLQAITYYNKALEIAKKNGYLDLISNCHEIIAQTQEHLGNQKEALVNFKLFKKYSDSLINKDTNSKVAELDIKFETTKKEKLLLQKEAESKQKTTYLIGLVLVALLIALLGFLIYRQQKFKNKQQEQEFELKTAISQIETQNKLQEQRLNISRDLHDNIGSQLTFIISSVDNVKYAFDIDNKKLDDKLTNISSFAKETIVELRDTIWAMNSNEITFEDLESRIHNFIEKAKEAKDEIQFSFAIAADVKMKKLTSVEGMNMYRTIQEAVNNAIKYAQATTIAIAINKTETQIEITIQDNGIGFDQDTIVKGNGLRNMQKRMEDIGGQFNIQSATFGTKVTLLLNA